MKQTTVYKGERAMVINDVDDAVKVMAGSGWSIKKPRGWKEPEAVAEDTIVSLRAQVDELTTVGKDLSEAIDGLIETNKGLIKSNDELTKQVEELTAPAAKGGKEKSD